MKKFSISIILSLFALTATAQYTNERVVGRNLLSGAQIMAKEHLFFERIHDYYVDATTNCITLQMRGTDGKWLNWKGNIVVYDLVNNEEKWRRKINYQGQSVTQSDNHIIFSRGRSYYLDAETGEEKWKTKNPIFYINSSTNIAFAHNHKRNLLQGIDLANGKVLWDRKIKQDYGWNDIMFLNDSTALIAAAGLHTVNLKDGTGWDYNAVTGQKDYSRVAGANLAGVAAGLLTGKFVITLGHDMIRDLVSNTLISDERIYFADSERLSCFDYDGNNKWSIVFGKDVVSHSEIFLKGDVIYMVNLGYAFMRDRQLDYGIPFIAAYNKDTGERVFVTGIGEMKSPIKSWTTTEDSILLLFEDNIANYSLTDGSVVLMRLFDENEFGQLIDFVTAFDYVKKDSGYEPMQDYIYAMNSDRVIVLNDSFEVIDEFEFDQIYRCYLEIDTYRFLTNGTNTVVMDDNNNEIALFEAGYNTFLLGDKLYVVKRDTIDEIDVKSVLSK